MCFCTRIQSKHKYFYSIYLSALGLSCSLEALSYSRWNLAPLTGINAPPHPPHIGDMESLPLDQQGSPQNIFKT